MGSFDLDDPDRLEAYETDEARRRQVPSEQIGSIRRRSRVTLMRISDSGSTQLRFQKEVGVDAFASLREVAVRGQPPFAWFRLEFLAPVSAGDESAPRRGDSVVVTEYPYSTARFRVGTFRDRPPDGVNRSNFTDDWQVQTPAELIQRLEEHIAYDPFLTESNRIMAGISDPGLSWELGEPKESREGRLAFGVCSDWEGFANRLVEQMADYREMALRGELRDGHASRHHTRNVRLLPLDFEEGQVDFYLALSARQALAGPAKPRDELRLRGKPVAVLVQEIFEQHMSRLRKEEWRRQRGLKDLLGRLTDGPPAAAERLLRGTPLWEAASPSMRLDVREELEELYGEGDPRRDRLLTALREQDWQAALELVLEQRRRG